MKRLITEIEDIIDLINRIQYIGKKISELENGSIEDIRLEHIKNVWQKNSLCPMRVESLKAIFEEILANNIPELMKDTIIFMHGFKIKKQKQKF